MNRSRGDIVFENGQSIAATRLSRTFCLVDSAICGVSMNVSPYSPPRETPSHSVGRTTPVYLLVTFTAMVVLIAVLGIFRKPPALLTPMPFLLAASVKLLGLTVPVVALLAGVSRAPEYASRPF